MLIAKTSRIFSSACFCHKIFKTLLLLQIAAKSFQTFPEISSQWSSQNCVWDFWNFENWNFNEFYSFSLTWDPLGVKISKRYYKSQRKYVQTSPEFSSQWSSQNSVLDFWNFEFLIINDFFFKNFKFTMVAYGEIRNLNYLENMENS